MLPALYRRSSASTIRNPGRIASPNRFSSAVASENLPNQNPKPFDSAPSSLTEGTDREKLLGDESKNAKARADRKDQWQEEQARVLRASLGHVIKFGWTEAAMIAGARAVGVSPSIVGSFPRKEAALVEFFMDDCLQKLVDIVDTDEDLKNLIPSHRIAKLVRLRLEMQAPYISKWPQALSIQAQPLNVSTSLKQRAMLVDEFWHAAGDESTDIDWYVKRTILGGIYSATELYMLTDNSPDFNDTWAFLDERVKEAFNVRKTFQEAKFLVEAMGAGMGDPVQGFMKRIIP